MTDIAGLFVAGFDVDVSGCNVLGWRKRRRNNE
jgi:hypothetical protein